MAQTIRRNAKPARRQARAQKTRTQVRQAKRKTNSLIDALMRVLPFTEEQLHKTFLVLILAGVAAAAWLIASTAGLTALHRHRAMLGPVFLSLRHLDAPLVRQRFPSLDQRLRDFGLDLARDLLPVAPAAHYCMGGVRTDTDGRTDVPGLYVAGDWVGPAGLLADASLASARAAARTILAGETRATSAA